MPARRAVLSLLAVAAIIGAGYWVFFSASDREQVIAVLKRLRGHFNEGASGKLIAAFAERYRDVPSGLERDELRGLFFQHFLQCPRHRDGNPLLQVQFAGGVPDRIEFDEGAAATGQTVAQRARVSCVLSFGERSASRNAEDESWRVRVRGSFEKTGGDWLLVETDWESLSGQPPF